MIVEQGPIKRAAGDDPDQPAYLHLSFIWAKTPFMVDFIMTRVSNRET